MDFIKIQNLGPIEFYEKRASESLTILIGEQASGKSTIAKTIFYCKSISEEFKKYLYNIASDTGLSGKIPSLVDFKKRLRIKFVEYFGTTKHMRPFLIEYAFDNGEEVSITLKEGYAQIKFSVKMEQQCKELITRVMEYCRTKEKYESERLVNFILWSNQTEELVKLIDTRVNAIFGQDYTSIFIPAGRSMLATNSEFFHMLTPNRYDILMNDFIERITILQKQYSQKIEDIVRDKKKMSSENIDFESVALAQALVKKILKGDYVNDKNGEKIYYNDKEFVKLVQASSGQQESLWIVLLLFSVILNKQKVYMVIEEPEAHLFPNAQRYMMELICLMIHATESKVILTTHSPYILTATNLAMYSSLVEKQNNSKGDVVPIKFRIPQKTVAAYVLREHKAVDIMDRENSMIDVSGIDTVSEKMNAATDELVEREMKDEL